MSMGVSRDGMHPAASPVGVRGAPVLGPGAIDAADAPTSSSAGRPWGSGEPEPHTYDDIAPDDDSHSRGSSSGLEDLEPGGQPSTGVSGGAPRDLNLSHLATPVPRDPSLRATDISPLAAPNGSMPLPPPGVIRTPKRHVQLPGSASGEPSRVPTNAFGSGSGTDAGPAPGSSAIPGQIVSFTAVKPLSRAGRGGGGMTNASTMWQSMARSAVGTADALPSAPPELPELHQAAWDDDLDQMVELLRARGASEPLGPLIWVNAQLYGTAGAAAGGGDDALDGEDAGRGGGGEDEEQMVATAPPPPPPGTAGGRRTVLSAAAPPAQPPLAATPSTATEALQALLRGDFLRHACHPLTIAAFRGNDLMVEELIKAMRADARLVGHEHPLTWAQPPREDWPPGCPWVTPLAAAALSGSDACVRLIAQAVHRRRLQEDRSWYGCFRFRALVVAQTAEAVASLILHGASNTETLRRLCTSARRVAKEEALSGGGGGGGGWTGGGGVTSRSHLSAGPSGATLNGGGGGVLTRRSSAGSDLAAGQASQVWGSTAAAAAAAAAAGSPMDSRAASGFISGAPSGALSLAAAHSGGLGLGLGPGPDAVQPRGSRLPGPGPGSGFALGPGSGPPQLADKTPELLLFRSRLFHDSLGRPLETALHAFSPETLAALGALTALVERGLEPDRFLSHAEHRHISSTSLLVVVVRAYRHALAAASGGAAGLSVFGGGAAGGAARPLSGGGAAGRPLSGGAAGADGDGVAGAGSTGSLGGWAMGGPGSDLLSAAHEVLPILVAELLQKGAAVDAAPRLESQQ
ncbi:hypothetical protein HYH03_018208, partial [Edaphochlamys debaryana]